MSDQPGVPPEGVAPLPVGTGPVPPSVPPPPAVAWGATGAAPTWGAPAAAPAPVPGASPTWGAPAAAPAPVPGSSPTWGAPVQVVARPKLMARSGMKTTLAVAAIMVGVVMGVNIVNAAVPLPEAYVDSGVNPAIPVQPPVDPGVPEPTADPGQPEQPSAAPGEPSAAPGEPTAAPVDPGPVSGGSTITVNDHFQFVMPDGWSLVSQEDGALVFQKGTVTFATGGTSYSGSVTDLAIAYRDVFFAAGNLRGEEPTADATSTGIPVAGLNYTGILNDVQVDGFILVALEDGSGMITNAFGPTGSLQAVSDDLSMILNSIRRAGE